MNEPPVGPVGPRRTYSLNGVWAIAPGEESGPSREWVSEVPVPGLVDCATPPYPWKESAYHWYRRTVRPGSALEGRVAILRIDQAMFGTLVKVNGTIAGSDIACYTSQEYDVTALLHADRENEILVRVGRRDTLPPESAVGNDQERESFIPGMWGDVHLLITGTARIAAIQVIPQIAESSVRLKVRVQNHGARERQMTMTAEVRTSPAGEPASQGTPVSIALHAGGQATVEISVPVSAMRLWSPADPFLYEAVVTVAERAEALDSTAARFGMREFTISGGDFLLNGERILLRGGNIAFHRFLSDPERATLPWDLAWAKRLLIDIPRVHHFNFFRNHLGQMYNRWYDLADEHGMLLQNEWPFWTTTGTREQITREFSRWLEDNWNHPSIVLWDALNESTDPVVEQEVIPAMKWLDPTRPWEPVDVHEQHPYIYSLGPVLVDRRFGFTDALDSIEKSVRPSMVNEFLWWWLDAHGEPTRLTREVLERWLGPVFTAQEVVARQSFLASELVELFRRMDVDAIQPFVYLSNSAGPTGHWFSGPIADLQPKPVLRALANAFAPFGLSVELWDRHFIPRERRLVPVHLFNDSAEERAGHLRWGVADATGTWVNEEICEVKIAPVSRVVHSVEFRFPGAAGEYAAMAEVHDEHGLVATSRKIAHVLPAVGSDERIAALECAFLDLRGETEGFLRTHGVVAVALGAARTAMVGEGSAGAGFDDARIEALTGLVKRGGTLILLEPEYGLNRSRSFRVLRDLCLEVSPRADVDRGGYDSYVFPTEPDHPLWEGLRPEHLRMFNGGYGGEAVSEHDIASPGLWTVHARCGLKLAVPVVMEIPFGNGRVLVSRLQVRGRLEGTGGSDLFARRPDPVAQQFLMNLVRYATRSALGG